MAIYEVSWITARHHDREKIHLIPDPMTSDRTACGYKIPGYAKYLPFDFRSFNQLKDCKKCRIILERGGLGSVT